MASDNIVLIGSDAEQGGPTTIRIREQLKSIFPLRSVANLGERGVTKFQSIRKKLGRLARSGIRVFDVTGKTIVLF